MHLTAAAVMFTVAAAPPRPVRPNVLYIVVDDLRVELPMYGQPEIQTPHLSALAERGVVFDRVYCNQPVCSPSRNSFMTGRRPDKTLSWNFKNHFREVGPRWTTLPSHFLHHNYLTLGTGKLYHEALPPNGDGTNSWTDSHTQFSCVGSSAGGAGTYCDPKMASCETAGPSFAPHPRWCTAEPATEYFADINTTRDALMKIGTTRPGVPFFLGVGIRKPHLDWRVPQSFLDKYPASSVSLAAHPVPPAGMPAVAYHDVARSPGEHQLWKGWGYTNPWTPIRNATAIDMRRHYYAAVSFMDSIVGDVLGAIEKAEQTSSTIVLFHADRASLPTPRPCPSSAADCLPPLTAASGDDAQTAGRWARRVCGASSS